jgi:hypothetical protein
VLHSGERFKKKKTGDGADGVKSSPRGSMTLGKGFSECTSFGTWGRSLPREPLPRVFWGHPRVLLTLGEGGFSCSGDLCNLIYIEYKWLIQNLPFDMIYYVLWVPHI